MHPMIDNNSHFPMNRFLMLTLAIFLTAGLKAAAEDKGGSIADLPSKPGAHVEKIKALGDNEWLNLGAAPPTRSGARHGAVRGGRRP